MSYSLSYTKKAEKFLDNVPKEHRKTIMRKIESIREQPFSHVKKLHGPFWRLRIQDYRAILDIVISGRKIIVLRIGHRKNVYEKTR